MSMPSSGNFGWVSIGGLRFRVDRVQFNAFTDTAFIDGSLRGCIERHKLLSSITIVKRMRFGPLVISCYDDIRIMYHGEVMDFTWTMPKPVPCLPINEPPQFEPVLHATLDFRCLSSLSRCTREEAMALASIADCDHAMNRWARLSVNLDRWIATITT